LHFEHRVRQREETVAAQAENRPRNNVILPAPPTYRKDTDVIEYPGDYDPSTIKKIKTAVE